MDKNMTLEKRIAAELYCYQGKMSVFVDDLQGHTVEVGADEEFETASTIKAFILAALYLQAQRGKADLPHSALLWRRGVSAHRKGRKGQPLFRLCLQRYLRPHRRRAAGAQDGAGDQRSF